MTRLISFGEILIDMLPADSRCTQFLAIAGGAPANVAVGFAKLGGQAFFAGGLATDGFAPILQNALHDYGVDTRYLVAVANSQTAMAVVTLDDLGERSFSFYRHNTADIQVNLAHFSAIHWQDDGIFHFCSNTLTDDTIAKVTYQLIQQAQKNQQLISFDVNLRPALWQKPTEIGSYVEQCFQWVDVIKLSQDELTHLAKLKGVNESDYLAGILHQGVKVIVLSNGPLPAKIVTQTETISLAAPTINAIDTTAAGDSLIAGFLFELSTFAKQQQLTLNQSLRNIACLQQALQFGLHCGALTCAQKGAFPALPELSAVLAFVESAKN
ncbi:carbohydrate kinase family protein [Pseudoalteromonas tunicata]|jgi:fructokinase|uniref:Carbohydrate kinase, PfkB family protein n=1 Tax=Pseudoalteromonas tunicata D2 TaxID=87626 RepID=A4CB16_9GAMM|nr:carbohydrate kinase [Pseudoalteromonas tunicata]ATC95117.1 fructokinase [Pseudoalteromonas tunicata]AXT30748.1 carbohydrate kinase [Pseudoalteromonas tunicata]EAR28574.1 carbohydrate kinase, PfkB family protein [Pseudoalteromonas tunicata D2]